MAKTVGYTDGVLREGNDNLLIQLFNCRVLKGEQIIDDHLWIRNGLILKAEKIFFDEKSCADIRVDCHGLILAPGFIDIQLNGGFGFDFSTWTGDAKTYEEGVSLVSSKLLQHGITSYSPTVITSSPETYKSVLPLLFRRHGGTNGARILGAHVEGPFICSSKAGAHPRQFIHSTFLPDVSQAIDQVYGSTQNIAIATVAPELPGALHAVRELRERGVVVSLGHSSSGLSDGESAVSAGASCLTHLYNAMQAYHHRDPGLIGLLASKYIPRPIYYGIIADGVHTHDSALRIAHSTAPEGLILVTDAIAALGMGDGCHLLGVQKVNVKGLVATLQGTDTAAGSVASMPLCMRHLVKAANCSIPQAILCATAKPASLLGLRSVGRIVEGMDADLVLLSQNLSVEATFIGGRLVFAPQ